MSGWSPIELLAVFTELQLLTLIAVMVLASFSRHPQPGFRCWLASLACLATAAAVRLATSPASPFRDHFLLASWIPFFASAIFMHQGVRRFRGRPSQWRADVALAGLSFAVALIAFAFGVRYTALVAVQGSVTALVVLRAALVCVRGVRPDLRATYYIFGAGLFLVAGANLLRAMIGLLGHWASDGTTRDLSEAVLFIGGLAGTTVIVVGAILSVGRRQQVELEDLQEVLRRQATTDPLTGLANRRHFFDRARRLLETPQAHSIVVLDIDHFKTVNDSFGHDLGDLVLRRVAKALADSMPKDGALGRLGGEEFVALLPGRASEVETWARRTLKSIETEAHRGILRTPVTLSAGVAAVSAEGLDEDLALADHRLYEAKRSGRNRVVAS